jgi:type IV pilus assembly protein PilV
MEVLVTIVVLSIGLLGLAGLQAKSQQFTQGSYLRSQAAVLANDIMDRMRANRDAAEDTAASQYAIDVGDPTPAAGDCYTAACDSDDMADFDLAEWLTLVAETLPSGDGGVATELLPSGNYLFIVTIQWDDPRVGYDEGSGFIPKESFIFRGEL